MTATLEEVARRMFNRNVADYAEPALAELAWIDPDIRNFWVQQAQDVMADLTDLTDLPRIRPLRARSRSHHA
jgi:hypothetical protein